MKKLYLLCAMLISCGLVAPMYAWSSNELVNLEDRMYEALESNDSKEISTLHKLYADDIRAWINDPIHDESIRYKTLEAFDLLVRVAPIRSMLLPVLSNLVSALERPMTGNERYETFARALKHMKNQMEFIESDPSLRSLAWRIMEPLESFSDAMEQLAQFAFLSRFQRQKLYFRQRLASIKLPDHFFRNALLASIAYILVFKPKAPTLPTKGASYTSKVLTSPSLNEVIVAEKTHEEVDILLSTVQLRNSVYDDAYTRLAEHKALQKRNRKIKKKSWDQIMSEVLTEKHLTLDELELDGLLLVGPPGSGKTMLARAVAVESNSPIIELSGSEFGSEYIRSGAKDIKNAFARARRDSNLRISEGKSPVVIVAIDEIDSIIPTRTHKSAGSRDTTHATNQMLKELTATNNGNILVIGTTNLVESIDPAARRAGRFEIVYVDYPDEAGREEIIRNLFAKFSISGSPSEYASKTEGWSGAELTQFVTHAHKRARHDALRTNAPITSITKKQLDDSYERSRHAREIVEPKRSRNGGNLGALLRFLEQAAREPADTT